MRSLTLARPQQRRRRPGFTFMEILFAVMILGIGFIMVAAMFPAALRQTQQNVEENEFNTIAHTAAQTFESLANNTDPRWAAYVKSQQGSPTPVTGRAPRLLDLLTGWVTKEQDNLVPLEWDPAASAGGINQQWGRPVPWSFHDVRFAYNGAAPTGNWSSLASVPPPGSTDPLATDGTFNVPNNLWDLVRGNMIMLAKPQTAWGALWARSQRMVNGKQVASPSVQLFIFPLRSRAKPEYDPNATVVGSNPAQKNSSCDLTYQLANLDPALITFHYYPPPKNAAASNAPNGVFELFEICAGPGGNFPQPYAANGSNLPPSVNPLAEGAYVVISDDQHHIVNIPMPAKYNGMIFKLGPEVADQSGTLGTSGGRYWSVAEVINMPSEQPFNKSTPSDIEPTALNNGGAGSAPHALVFGRQPDPADAVQHSDSQRSTFGQSQKDMFNRTGVTQELGYFPWSVVVQQ